MYKITITGNKTPYITLMEIDKPVTVEGRFSEELGCYVVKGSEFADKFPERTLCEEYYFNLDEVDSISIEHKPPPVTAKTILEELNVGGKKVHKSYEDFVSEDVRREFIKNEGRLTVGFSLDFVKGKIGIHTTESFKRNMSKFGFFVVYDSTYSMYWVTILSEG